MVHEIVLNHFGAESLFVNELSPGGFEIGTIRIDIVALVDILMPSDRGTMLLKSIGMCLALV